MKNRGFTLIELMILVAIVAILIAIFVPACSGASKWDTFKKENNCRELAGSSQLVRQPDGTHKFEAHYNAKRYDCNGIIVVR